LNFLLNVPIILNQIPKLTLNNKSAHQHPSNRETETGHISLVPL